MMGDDPSLLELSTLRLKPLASASGRAPPTLSFSTLWLWLPVSFKVSSRKAFDDMLLTYRTSFVPPPNFGATDSEPSELTNKLHNRHARNWADRCHIR